MAAHDRDSSAALEALASESRAHTDLNGPFGSAPVPEDDYVIEVHAPGASPAIADPVR